jgi:dimethylargininase
VPGPVNGTGLIALTRGVSPTFGACQLEYLARQEIDVARAVEQHRGYESALRELGVRVVSLPADPEYPDGLFVEDPAVVLDEIAVMGRMAKLERRGETESLAAAIADFRPLAWLRQPATLEGGDVMQAGNSLYIGVSRRTNCEAVRQLAEIVAALGYRVAPVSVDGCMHLKTACSYLGDGTVLANRKWIDAAALAGLHVIDVPPEEPWAANVLRIGETLLIPSAFPKTRELLEEAGFTVKTVDTSELAKAEAGMTCMSLLFVGQVGNLQRVGNPLGGPFSKPEQAD